MSEQLARAAEKLKLARLLEADPDDLGYLDDVPALEIRTLRERLTDSFFDSDRRLFGGWLPLPGWCRRRSQPRSRSGPSGRCCAPESPPAPTPPRPSTSRRGSRRLSSPTRPPGSTPRRVAAIIAGVPTSLAVPVAQQPEHRGEYVTMGRFLAFLPDELIADAARGPIADQVASLEPALVEGLVAAVWQQDLWTELLPVVGLMSPAGRLQLASRPAFHKPEILREIVESGARGGLWLQLVPLLRALPPYALADDLDEAGRARVTEAIDGADREVGRVLVEELSDPDQVRLLLDHAPPDIVAAVERAADRVGLRAEYDAAVTAAQPGVPD